MKKNIIITLTIFLALIGAGIFLYPKYSFKKTDGITTICSLSELRKEEKQLWQEIKELFNADLEAFHKTKSTIWYEQPKKETSANNPTEELIFNVARDFNYNTDALIIKFMDIKETQSSAGVSKTDLMINTNVFPSLPQSIQKFVIGHELFHLVNNDVGEKEEIVKNLEDPEKISKEQEELFYRYLRFQEKRADMQAALLKKEWADLYLEYTTQGLKRCPIEGSLTHPSFKERKQLAQNIVTSFNTSVQTA